MAKRWRNDSVADRYRIGIGGDDSCDTASILGQRDGGRSSAAVRDNGRHNHTLPVQQADQRNPPGGGDQSTESQESLRRIRAPSDRFAARGTPKSQRSINRGRLEKRASQNDAQHRGALPVLSIRTTLDVLYTNKANGGTTYCPTPAARIIDFFSRDSRKSRADFPCPAHWRPFSSGGKGLHFIELLCIF